MKKLFNQLDEALKGVPGNYLDLMADKLKELGIEIQPLRSFKNINKLMTQNASIINDVLFLAYIEQL